MNDKNDQPKHEGRFRGAEWVSSLGALASLVAVVLSIASELSAFDTVVTLGGVILLAIVITVVAATYVSRR